MRVSFAKNEEVVSAQRSGAFAEALTAVCVLAGAACLFGLLFNRETALSYSIGYNLYGAERILKGEVPYRDFHTLYPPATVYLNAALFKILGVRLYTALLGVFVFKALTTISIYLAGRQVMTRWWAIAGALYSMIWLRPNGPFKAVPMHYGALFLATALYSMLRYQKGGRAYHLVVTGISVGLLALFKHNIGGYALIGFSACILLYDRPRRDSANPEDDEKAIRGKSGSEAFKLSKLSALTKLLLGFAVPVVPVVLYLATRGALGAMVKTLLLGPGEFLVSRLAGVPSPILPAIAFLGVGGFAVAVFELRSRPAAATGIALLGAAAVALFCLASSEARISEVLFYTPLVVIGAGTGALVYRKKVGGYAWPIGPLTVAAAAAFMEAFPRFAREQAVAAMPFVGLLLIYLVFVLWRVIGNRMVLESARPGRLGPSLALLPFAFLLLGLRLFHHTYFVNGLSLRSDTELGIERGRRVYFPPDTARQIDDVTRYIQQHVGEGGYLFAQSSAGSAFLFLANRKNPSGAQFWGGVGVSADERAATLAALEQRQVRVIITSANDMDAERYEPLRDYIARNFRQTGEFAGVIVLERVSE